MKRKSLFLLLGSLPIFLLSLPAICIIIHSCKKIIEPEPELTVPVLTTVEVSVIMRNSAYSGGRITSDGGTAITQRGVCWSTSPNPTTASNITADSPVAVIFESTLSGLTEDTKYYVRAYATNSKGTGYGNEVSFTTLPISVATIQTYWVCSITKTMAWSHGFIEDTGGGTITAWGMCWSTSENPTVADNKTSEDVHAYLDGFDSYLRGLTTNTTYYVRAYVTTNIGTSYGEQRTFTTASAFSPIVFNPDLSYGTVWDLDGNEYKTIQIGAQTWMAENLKTTKLNDGTAIPDVVVDTVWSALTSPGYCWYNNEPDYTTGFGALYNWYAVNTSNLCPLGWHVPTEDEWSVLVNYLGGMDEANAKIRETGTKHWQSVTSDATNSSGFTAIPTGVRFGDGRYLNLGIFARFWSSTITSYNPENANSVDWMWWDTGDFTSWSGNRGGNSLMEGESVRCLKDN
jgi:uncharacterized protein (TIGR02145 family)